MDTTSSKNSTSMQENTKRGRKKQLHPQQVLEVSRLQELNYDFSSAKLKKRVFFSQVLPPFRVGESLAVAGSPKPAEDPNLDQEQSLLHCSLCNEVYPSANYMKHLKDFHKVKKLLKLKILESDSRICCFRLIVQKKTTCAHFV